MVAREMTRVPTLPRAFNSSICRPFHGAVVSGRYSWEHGANTTLGTDLNTGVKSLPKAEPSSSYGAVTGLTSAS